MKPPRRSVASGLIAVAAAAVLSSACSSARSPGAVQANVPGAAPNGELRDRVTASDESEATKRARTRLELASAYFGIGQMTTALDNVKLAIQADPGLGEAFNLRGLVYANLGDEPLAEESFRRALQLNPGDADAMQNFGFFFCRQKRYSEADAMFDQALSIPQYRDVARTLLTKGVCQAFAGQLAESERTLGRAYELDPSNPSAAVNLSEVLFRRGELERARFYIRRVNAMPTVANAQTLWLAARIENALGNRQGVKDFGSQLQSRYADSPEWSKFARGAFNE